jgi:hypothetical protein
MKRQNGFCRIREAKCGRNWIKATPQLAASRSLKANRRATYVRISPPKKNNKIQ